MMDWMMPLFSVYIAFVVPAAIGVYWIFKSLLGIVKQALIKITMPIPTFTEEDYKAAEREVGTAKPEKNVTRTKSGKVVRSLHHIDDEDFADTAEAGRKRREALEAQAAQEAAQAAERTKSRALGEASVKKDERPEKTKAKKADKAEGDESADTNENNDQKDGE
jgi:YidC/Oxa1 family membrane protein insertase